MGFLKGIQPESLLDVVPEQAICHMMRELVLPEAREAYQVDWQCV